MCSQTKAAIAALLFITFFLPSAYAEQEDNSNSYETTAYLVKRISSAPASSAITCPSSPCQLFSGKAEIYYYHSKHDLENKDLCPTQQNCVSSARYLSARCLDLHDVVYEKIGFDGSRGYWAGNMNIYIDDQDIDVIDRTLGGDCKAQRHETDKIIFDSISNGEGSGTQKRMYTDYVSTDSIKQFPSDIGYPKDNYFNPDPRCYEPGKSGSCQCIGWPDMFGGLDYATLICSNTDPTLYSYYVDFISTGWVDKWNVSNPALFMLRASEPVYYQTDIVKFSVPVSEIESAKLVFNATGSNPGHFSQGDLGIYVNDNNGNFIEILPVIAFSGSKIITQDIKNYLRNDGIYFVIYGYDDSKYSIQDIRVEFQKKTTPKPDITLTSSDISFSNQNPIAGETITITAFVSNTGTADASNVRVDFYDRDDYINKTTIPSLLKGEKKAVNTKWTAQQGNRRIDVWLDRAYQIDELNEENNYAFKTIDVGVPPVQKPDIIPSNIRFSNPNPTEGDTITISIDVSNIGTANASNVKTEMRIDGNYHSSKTENIQKSITKTLNFSWVAAKGSHEIKFVADPQNTIDETDEVNNQATQTIYVDEKPQQNKPDLEISEMGFDIETPEKGDVISIYAFIENKGERDVTGAWIYWRVDGTLVGTMQINLTKGSKLFRWHDWEMKNYGRYSAEMILDEPDYIDETDETNNRAERMLNSVPYIVPSISTIPNLIEGQKTNITVTLSNIGGTSAIDENVRLLIDGMVQASWALNLTNMSSSSVIASWVAVAGHHNLTLEFEKYSFQHILRTVYVGIPSPTECGPRPTTRCKVTGDTVFENGVYNLPGGITIEKDAVLDCNGATLNGSPNEVGISIEANATVRNCHITNYYIGISYATEIVESPFVIIYASSIENNIIEGNKYGIGINKTFCDEFQSRPTGNAAQIGVSKANLFLSSLESPSSDPPLTTNITKNKIINNKIDGICYYSIGNISENLVAGNGRYNMNIILAYKSEISRNTIGLEGYNRSGGIVGFSGAIYTNIYENIIGWNYDALGYYNPFYDNPNYKAAGGGLNFYKNLVISNNNTLSFYDFYDFQQNKFYQNIFVNNTKNINIVGHQVAFRDTFWGINDTGNYWSDYDEPHEGCYDYNDDMICDSPKIIDGNNTDMFPFREEYGWLNRPPKLQKINNITANEGETIFIRLNATAYGNSTLRFSTDAASVLPSNFSFSQSIGLFRWTPNPDDDGSYRITFFVTDGKKYTNTSAVIVIRDSLKPDMTVDAWISKPYPRPEETFTLFIDVKNIGDANAYNATIIKEFYGNISSGGSESIIPLIEKNSNITFQYPWSMKAGNYLVLIGIDRENLIDEKNETNNIINFSLEIYNHPPVLLPIDAASVIEGRTVSIHLNAMDQNSDMLVYFTNANEILPSPFDFDSSSGMFAWTPGIGNTGIYNVTFNVTDNELWDSKTIMITVFNNSAPHLDFMPNITARAGDMVVMAPNASDPDGDSVSISINDTRFTKYGNEFMWQTEFNNTGTFSVAITATDGFMNATQEISITINPGVDLFLSNFKAYPNISYVNETVMLTFNIKNIGNTTSKNIYFFIDSGYDGLNVSNSNPISLRQNQMSIVSFYIKYLKAGTYIPKLFADIGNLVPETDETNNMLETSMIINQTPKMPKNMVEIQ